MYNRLYKINEISYIDIYVKFYIMVNISDYFKQKIGEDIIEDSIKFCDIVINKYIVIHLDYLVSYETREENIKLEIDGGEKFLKP